MRARSVVVIVDGEDGVVAGVGPDPLEAVIEAAVQTGCGLVVEGRAILNVSDRLRSDVERYVECTCRRRHEDERERIFTPPKTTRQKHATRRSAEERGDEHVSRRGAAGACVRPPKRQEN